MSLPASFLSPIPPPNAIAHKIDFTSTTPPIHEYRDDFALVIDNFLTEQECQTLIQTAEASTGTGTHNPNSPDSRTAPTWHRALVNAGNGKQTESIDRNCGRIIHDSPVLALKILTRLQPFLADAGIETIFNRGRITGLGPFKRQEVFQVSRLNERMRFLRYEGGEFFRPHWDAVHQSEDGEEVSLFTIHLYLNGDGEQDLEELERAKKGYEASRSSSCSSSEGGAGELQAGRGDPSAKLLGGATSFQNGFSESNKKLVRVFPKTGSLLIFQQRNLLHAGDDVYRGVKYTMRTDILYRKSLRV